MKRTKRELRIKVWFSPAPMTAEGERTAERLIARLIARAFAADHPQLFGKWSKQQDETTVSGPPAAAAVLPEPKGTQR